ncbi:DgyrCDS11557 [Dimorphilus gyrociliatus]|uniref:DgyrCDS11557 n=1 Tax=Dimorphilus gyrociliatus TaxID=2664684 RepID=A0A7I8W3Y5_9ANNE|nr:DgyrCDS11557 [Dimorphilus gyrociliatus]
MHCGDFLHSDSYRVESLTMQVIVNAVAISGAFFATLLLNSGFRVKLLQAVFIFSAFVSLLQFVTTVNEASSFIVQSIFSALLAFLVTLLLLHGVEAFPTEVRTTGLGLLWASKHLGASIGVNAFREAPSSASAIISAILMIAAAFLCRYVPDNRKRLM